jgi:imidazoleglycerol-phosphate dehydratase
MSKLQNRTSHITRETGETQIELSLNLDGDGVSSFDLPAEAGLPFLQHMLTAWSKHGGFDLEIKARGDLEVDAHHLVEDLGIVLGAALNDAVGEKRGIARYGFFIAPMDESLVLCAVDFCGRAYPQLDWNLQQARIGEFDTFLAREFFIALANNARLNLHIRELSGGNAHHVIEAAFKAMARAMRAALKIEGDALPSTKGVL